jgi:hypothetical protein
LNKYSLKIKTKYQSESFKIEFKCANGSIELVNKNESKLASVNYETFPVSPCFNEIHSINTCLTLVNLIEKFGGLSYPIYLQSKFMQNLKIDSIEFTDFGNAFSFKWNLLNLKTTRTSRESNVGYENGETNSTTTQNVFVNTYGIIKSNVTTYIGQMIFNSKVLCQPVCYLGLEPKVKTSSSIIDISSIKIKNLNSLENLDESFIYELWLKSLNTDQLKYSNAHDLDMKLLELFYKRWVNLNKRQSLFKSSLKIHVNLEQNASDLLSEIKEKSSEEGETSNFFFGLNALQIISLS